jgi:hypothetical protein
MELASTSTLHEKMTNIEEYEIDLDNQIFKIQLGKMKDENKIIFKVEDCNFIRDYYFISSFSLKELISVNKLFSQFDSIDDVYIGLTEVFKHKQPNLEIKSNLLKLHLSLTNALSKTKDIALEIKKEKIDEKNFNEKILKELIAEKRKNENLTKMVNKVIEEKNELKKIVEEIIKWKECLEKKNDKSFQIDSNIFVNKEEVDLLTNRFINKKFLINKEVKYNLLYRASRDGDSPREYHNRCDGNVNTLYLIKTSKGSRFGGYTEIKIDSNVNNYKDPNSFIFSLNKMKIYENKKKEAEAICHSGSWGPIFRGGFSLINKNFFSYDEKEKDNIKTKDDSPFFEGIEDYEDFEINNGEQYFNIEEFEVFQISFK